MDKKLFIICAVSLLIDQITKILVDTFLKVDEVVSIIGHFFSLTKVFNTGAAFSILENKSFFLAIISIIVLVSLFYYMKIFKKANLVYLAFGLILGGILGNLVDRIFLGYVRDFLKFNILGYNFPIFNIADTCIVVGVGLLIICIMRGYDKSENNR